MDTYTGELLSVVLFLCTVWGAFLAGAVLGGVR